MQEYTVELTRPGVVIKATNHDPNLLVLDVQSLLARFCPGAPELVLPLPVAVPIPAKLPELPKTLANYCNSWLGEWAQEDCRARAYALYRENGNWETTMQELMKQDGEGAPVNG